MTTKTGLAAKLRNLITGEPAPEVQLTADAYLDRCRRQHIDLTYGSEAYMKWCHLAVREDDARRQAEIDASSARVRAWADANCTYYPHQADCAHCEPDNLGRHRYQPTSGERCEECDLFVEVCDGHDADFDWTR